MNRFIIVAIVAAFAGLAVAFAVTTGDPSAALAGGLEWGSNGR